MKIKQSLVVFFMLLTFTHQIIFPISKYTKPIIENAMSITNLKFEKNANKWEIEIPKINLKAEIRDGTDSENLNKYVGHFMRKRICKWKCCISST